MTEDIGYVALDSQQPETDFQRADNQPEFRYKSGISGKLVFERVNEVTWKLTDGEKIRTPASHGQWGGYNTTRAVAWVIEVAPGRWLARCDDRACGPDTLPSAKKGALAMAKGACGEYTISNPIAHLNGITARLLDAAAA
jgi:hypothetical protein